jgi:hypothetical protein
MQTIYISIQQSPSGSILGMEIIPEYPEETKFGQTIVQVYRQDWGWDLTYTPTNWA